MPWYIDLLMIAFLCACGTAVLAIQMKDNREATLLTKDGYPITIPQMIELEKKRTFNSHTFAHLTSEVYTSKGDIFFISGVIAILAYVTAGNLVEYFLPIQNLVVGILTLVLVMSIFLYESQKSFKKSVAFIAELSIESPEEFKQYGTYAKNPFDAKATMDELVKLEEKWEKAQTLRDNQERKLEEIVKESSSKKNEWLQYQIETLENHEKQLRKLGSEMTIKAGLLSKNLLTDNPPKVIKDIIEAKQSVVKSITEEPSMEEPSEVIIHPKKAVPHYIEVMKQIVLNPNLPKAVTDEAQALVDAYEINEENEERQREIDNALLEIQTVKRYIA